MIWETVIGLETHVELATRTKIFCSCTTEFGGDPNTHCCPVCTGMPGTLPVLNGRVLEFAVKAGLALNCQITRYSRFDRKNYFYPDLPKAYQISQLYLPIARDGAVSISTEAGDKTIRIHELHMEEDAGKLAHDPWIDQTRADYNRCGVPLIEIVTQPDFRTADEVIAYLEKLKETLQYLGVSDCKMQEGSLRCDVNLSVRPLGGGLGTRTEMKNLNSFKAIARAIGYEAKRQIELIEGGKRVVQETRRWDENKDATYAMRSKEDAQDYRYFPEPDLGAIVVPEELLEALRATIPELPGAKLLRYMKETGLPFFDANLLCENPDKADYFEKCLALGLCQPKAVSNWLLGDVSRILNEKNKAIADTRLTPEKLCQMIALIEKKTISNTAGKTVLEEIIWSDKTPGDVVKEKGLAQISDTSALEAIVQSVIDANQKVVADFHGGKTNALGFLVGQCMRQSKGQGNPAIIRELLEKALG